MVATKILTKAGLEVKVAPDGERAVGEVVEGSVDVVFMDLSLPGIDGFEAARRIRQHEAGSGKRVPIYALSAHVMQKVRRQCEEAGMDGFITKPINARELIHTVCGMQ
jgi:CheY-like chemotaxis protein